MQCFLFKKLVMHMQGLCTKKLLSPGLIQTTSHNNDDMHCTIDEDMPQLTRIFEPNPV